MRRFKYWLLGFGAFIVLGVFSSMKALSRSLNKAGQTLEPGARLFYNITDTGFILRLAGNLLAVGVLLILISLLIKDMNKLGK